MTITAFSQDYFTPAGYSDTVYDKSGNKYALRNIMIDPGPNPESQALAATTVSCQTGYFRLYFAVGSGLDGPGSPDIDRRAVLCQLFSDLSCFIKSPLNNSACHSTTNTTTFVNIYIDGGGLSGLALANASTFYTFPLSPLSPIPGITEGAVHKTIVSGVDAYQNVIAPLAIFAQSNNFYHGIINVNTTGSVNWYYNTTNTVVPATFFDFYSVMLHEAMHALGFNSLISPTGSSLFSNSPASINNNYYSMYDKFLKDYLGNYIITNNSNPCSNINYTLNTFANVSSLSGSFCAVNSDLTNCSTAPHYVGTVNVPVYHPNCYELGSSLSHFEDMCYPTVTPSNNNQIFLMANSYGGLKRYPREEERYVLCDLGYSVEPTYNSPVSGAQNTYTGGACSGTNIWGVNDGLNSSGYSFVGAASINIPLSTIMANDAPSTTSISCLSFVYNYPGITLSVISGSVVLGQIGGPNNYCGPILLQYIPKNNLGQSGNVTYIYAYFPCIGGCNPPNICNMVQNGGFESLTTSSVCAGQVSTSSQINCWELYKQTPDFVNKNCSTSPFSIYQLGVSPALLPLIDTWNGGSGNSIALGLLGLGGPQTTYIEESIKTNLSAPLVPTNTYVISFWAYNLKNGMFNAPTTKDVVITFASAPNMGVVAPSPWTVTPFPSGLNTIQNFTLPAADINTWKHYTVTAIFTATAQHNCLIIGPNQALSNAANGSLPNMQFYTYIDDVSILPVGVSASFSPPATICLGGSVNNLAQYTTVNGSFSGTGVTNSGGIYDFNAAPNNTLSAGSYPIVFTYTNVNGCVNTTVNQIIIAGIATNSAFCSYNSYTLNAFGYQSGTTYTWLPSGQTTPSITVSGSVNITYTLLTSYSVCPSTTFAPNIVPNTIITSNSGPWCFNQSPQPLGIAIPNYTVPTAITQTWSASSLTVPVIFANYTGILNPVYSATTSASGCTNIATYTATWLPKVVLTVANQPATYCSNIGIGVAISATASPSAGITYTWMPGNLTGQSQTVTPSSTTIYTVTAGFGNLCTTSNVLTVNVSSVCCIASNYMSPAPTSGTYTGSWAINQNITINSPITFDNAEFKIAKDVTITINNGGTLTLQYCHLYSCGDMWSGIVVNNGGQVGSPAQVWNPNLGQVFDDNNVLIEDAINAISMDGCTNTNTVLANYNIIMQNVIFNKNYVGINFKNYNYANRPPVEVNNCVFTSRTLTFTPTMWPSPTTTLNALRYVSPSTPTTGLASPYPLQSAAIVNLKVPYTNQSARIGILLDNVGTTSGGNYSGFEIGDASDPLFFNLFDALMFSIEATNSNVNSFNNVYQNTQRVYFCPRCYYAGGTAIRMIINSDFNARLNTTAVGTYSTNYSVGNRFWNCHKAIEATNLYRLNCNYGTFRSTQTITTPPGSLLLPGNYGISNQTNRFEHDIRYNKFNNINSAIVMNIYTGTYTFGASSYNGILANNILIDFNYFGAQVTNGTGLGTAFLNNAVYLSSTSITGWQNIAGLGLRIANNEVNKAFRGFYVETFAYPSIIQSNTISLLNDNYLAVTQRGISVGGNATGSTNITKNKLNAANTTNTLVTLVYTGASPASGVTCNTLSASYQAFEFNSNNGVSIWKGNSMTTHARGLVLSNNGIIGTQGAVGAPSDNRWNTPAAWAGANGTYVDITSNAINSKLWVKNTGFWVPQTPGGPAFGQTYGAVGNTSITAGTYVCSSPPPPAAMALSFSVSSNTPNMLSANSNNASAEEQYITDNTTYRYLEANPVIKNSSSSYVNFYNTKANTSFDKFKQTEASLSNGQIAQAQNSNNSINVSNTVEDNYKTYYNLFAKYKQDTLRSTDSVALINLAKLCPGLDGAVVYQARALYNLNYNTVKFYKEDCNIVNSNSRFMTSVTEKEILKNRWTVDLYPNPNNGNFTLVSKTESEELALTITDMAGKLIYNATVNTSNFIVNLDLNTKPGIYLITITNSTNESITKKLVIAD